MKIIFMCAHLSYKAKGLWRKTLVTIATVVASSAAFSDSFTTCAEKPPLQIIDKCQS